MHLNADSTYSQPEFHSGAEIHVWHVAVASLRGMCGPWHQILPIEEQRQANAFVFARDRERYVTSHYALRTVLGRYLRVGERGFAIQRAKFGKPFVRDYDIHFNLSHSGDAALVAVSASRELGIDIEQEKVADDAMKIVERFFSPTEIAAISRVKASGRQAAFLRCWTRKEAYVKALGFGMSLAFDSFSVPVAEACRAHPMTAHDGSRWTLESLGAFSHPAAIAYRGEPCPVRTLEFTVCEA